MKKLFIFLLIVSLAALVTSGIAPERWDWRVILMSFSALLVIVSACGIEAETRKEMRK